MLKVLNIGRGKTHGGAARCGRVEAGRPTHSEVRRDIKAARVARNRAFMA